MQLSDSLMVFNNGHIAAYFPEMTGLNDVMLGEYMLGLKQQSPGTIREVCHEE